jgi:hypothetical protein
MTDLTPIRERLREAQYAVRCAQGAGAFGPAEQEMLRTFQEHAIADLETLLDHISPTFAWEVDIDMLVVSVVRTRREAERALQALSVRTDEEHATAQPPVEALRNPLGLTTRVLESPLSDADNQVEGNG